MTVLAAFGYVRQNNPDNIKCASNMWDILSCTPEVLSKITTLEIESQYANG